MAEGTFIAYYRVSTQRQGESGLGLEAQRHAVTTFLNGGDWRLVEEFSEIESGRRGDRPELAKALAACRRHRATLVIAKIDRLSRDAHFLLGLKKAEVPFVAVDMPHANRLTVGIMALVAEDEAERIAARTKAALAAAKARGVRLGGRRVTPERHEEIRAAGRTARTAKAEARAADLSPVISEIRAKGHTSLRAVAAELDARGIPAPRGGSWSPVAVKRVLDRTSAH